MTTRRPKNRSQRIRTGSWRCRYCNRRSAAGAAHACYHYHAKPPFYVLQIATLKKELAETRKDLAAKVSGRHASSCF
jgi:ribosomal protein L37AE/L43A